MESMEPNRVTCCAALAAVLLLCLIKDIGIHQFCVDSGRRIPAYARVHVAFEAENKQFSVLWATTFVRNVFFANSTINFAS